MKISKEPFRAYRIERHGDEIKGAFAQLTLDDLSDGDTVIRVTHSTINYKDALAATGAGKIARRYPLVGGIDLAGEVVESADPELEPGLPVVVNGSGLSETRDGGYAPFARVPAEVVVPLPSSITPRIAMQIGTAGFTAALAIHRMEQNGQTPDLGPIVVTGATGGVGSLSLDMLAARGYEAVALTGKSNADDYLQTLGARRVLARQELDVGKRPLETAEWGGAIDNLGGEVLTWLTRTTRYGGNIASVGLAAGVRLDTTVIPFILRAVCLLGINSVETPRDLRFAVWRRLGSDLRPRHLESIAPETIDLDELPERFAAYLDGAVTGRVVVRIE